MLCARLKQLEQRAYSITARNMTDLLTSAEATCRSLLLQGKSTTALSAYVNTDSSLEFGALPIYQRFKALVLFIYFSFLLYAYIFLPFSHYSHATEI